MLERHKEKTPKDPTVREKFNTYRFAEHKEQVIELLQRVCTVSVQTSTSTAGMSPLPSERGSRRWEMTAFRLDASW